MRELGDEVVQEEVRSPLRVLLLDDNPDDRILAKRELAKAFPGVQVEEVVDGGDFASALERGGFDVVITDFQLRWSDGLRVLQEVKGKYPFCPVVMFTATGSEELAVEVMKKGLDDYIIKTAKHFVRLPATVGSVLRAAEEKRRRLGAERELATARRDWESIFQAIGHPTFILDDSFRVVEVNKATEGVTGVRRKELLGKRCFEFMHPSDDPPPGCPLERILEEGGDHGEGEMEALGLTLWVSCTPVPGENGLPTKYIHIATDITPRREMEDKLKETTTRLETLINATPDIVCFKDAEGRWLEANEAGLKLFQLEGVDYWGKKDSELAELTHPVYREAFLTCERTDEEAWRKGTLYRGDDEILLPDGTTRVYDIIKVPLFHPDGSRKGLVVLGRDVTERRRMEEELLKMEKLESLGVLAGGIAHDFNNILTAILGHISLAKVMASSDSEVQERLEDAERACFRAKSLTKQLLTFSKGGAPVKEVTSIPKIIEESVKFVLRGSNVKGEISLPEDLWPAEVDPVQVSQVIQNLVLNAKEAMPKGGTIRIEAENATVEAGGRLPLDEGRYLKITFRDEGIGIPPNLISYIFDPYFTTKQEGSGLGLATAYSILRKHGGYIGVESEVGVGTTFYVYLPASEAELSVTDGGGKKEDIGRGRVLLMDDEESVRDVAGRMLAHLGYDVECAEDGGKAIAIYEKAREEGEGFDVVIMDLTVPGGMGGQEAIGKLLEIDPGVRAIVSSGYSDDPVMAQYREYGFSGFLSKPYKMADIARVISEVTGDKG